ncbi:MAG: AcrR family transcriptional regulator [Halopseudomonas sp.]|jgi:TetR/AcrR family transcriptional repressor of uid operon|uniref:TetR/AcrR family transcriptional regulator n=1 Tax=Haliea salexigens TaxID=287487 RepID=UPI0003F9CB62|nr:TetR/AcrR family transcriptional regulator [Haliea salexigens]|tara:strand:+ start:8693 stop:9319 length:627 start_codon:yes stop_codon:yes gene_type:complete
MVKTSKKAVPDQPPRERIINAARLLFGAKGFHPTTTAELAAEASVSMGQIYRHFDSKSDIVLAIVEQNVHMRLAQMDAIFEAVECGSCSIFEAFKTISESSLALDDSSLSYEILAEAVRNASVAEKLETLTTFFQDGVRRLAVLAQPDIPPGGLEAYVDIMMACFVGLGLRTALNSSVDVDQASRSTACLMLRMLGASDDGLQAETGA